MTRGVSLLLGTVAALVLTAGTAQADTFVVTKRGDPVPGACKKRDCSLREAVFAANMTPGRDVIVLPNRRKAYNLRQAGTNEDGALDGDLDVSNNPLVIRHPGRGKATIDANGIERVFEVFAGAPTTFRKLVIRGGASNLVGSGGGGIRNDANVRVIRSRVVGNSAEGGVDSPGGGIASDGGTLRLVRSVVKRNEAESSGGGGVAVAGRGGALVVRRSTVAANEARAGGGIYIGATTGASRIAVSTVAGNRATGSDGGGITQRRGEALRIRRTTIARNKALGARADGGGIDTSGVLRLSNSTVAENRTDGAGGGMAAPEGANVSLNAVTIARNVADSDADDSARDRGGGLAATLGSVPSRFEVENSLIALNRLGSGRRDDCVGFGIDSLGRNLLSKRPPAGECDGFDRATDRIRRRPKIGKLRRNGGPTRTIALRRGSPAVNRARRATAPNRDQRGKRRGRRKDIGAYERNTGR